jgi:hypothetical protein
VICGLPSFSGERGSTRRNRRALSRFSGRIGVATIGVRNSLEEGLTIAAGEVDNHLRRGGFVDGRRFERSTVGGSRG